MPTDPTEVFFDLFEPLPQHGPGSEASTLKALSYLKDIPKQPRILDLGCGAGLRTVLLAKATGGTVIGMDLKSSLVERLEAAARKAGLADHVTALEGSMKELSFPEESFDVIWSEGAIYNIGFEKGLKYWRQFVKPGGYVVVSEVCYVTEDIPEELESFWDEEYPEIEQASILSALATGAGYEMIAEFNLPASDWKDNFYDPLIQRLEELAVKYRGDSVAEEVINRTRREIDIFTRYHGVHVYRFFIMRR
ncbi:MAG TPA: class I SAM-dependent methyltransferase [candidate division Zixibacteria bacterium]|nr:class I SAM-dependent methyltransferase [candidate division Zixibacteria bacterium]